MDLKRASDKVAGKGNSILPNSTFSIEDLQKQSKQELIELILNHDDLQIPVAIFNNDAGPLECLVKYLNHNRKLPVKAIAEKLNRNVQTIWTTQRNIKLKQKEIIAKESGLRVPLRIFLKQDKSILESLTHYLNTNLGLRFCDVSRLLARDIRTVWVYHQRYLMKEKKRYEETYRRKKE